MFTSITAIELFQEHAQTKKPLLVQGFVKTIRRQSKIAFVVLEFSGATIQVCQTSKEWLEYCKTLTVQSFVQWEVLPVLHAQAPQGVEMQWIKSIQECIAKPLPIQEETDESIAAQWPTLKFRTPKQQLILKTQSKIVAGLRQQWEEEGFTEMTTPKLMSSPSESGAEVFEVKYFEDKAYLAQSPQFYKQMAILSGLEKMYEIGPVFRAEPSFSSRHCTEFISIDVEMLAPESAESLARQEHAWIKQALAYTSKALPELKTHYPKATELGELAVVTYTQAREMLKLSEKEEPGFSAQQEKELGALFALQGVEMFAITELPFSLRPFYHHQKQPGVSESFELIYRGVEITTGAVREHRPEVLQQQLKEKGLSGIGMESYLSAFEYGAPPHGGFGLGLSRLVQLWLDLPSVRHAQFIARTPTLLTP